MNCPRRPTWWCTTWSDDVALADQRPLMPLQDEGWQIQILPDYDVPVEPGAILARLVSQRSLTRDGRQVDAGATRAMDEVLGCFGGGVL